jgi:CelD/BcsL family acetyltransferase involved in cellulose biosynthesis
VTDVPQLRFRHWSVEDFAHGREAWTALLANSRADPMFMSWEWHWAWWSHLSVGSDELYIVAAYTDQGKLVGLAPLYLHRGLHRGVAANRLESLGSRWRSRQDVFSEYLDFIVARDHEAQFSRGIAAHVLADDRWSDFVLRNVRDDSVANRAVREHLGARYYVRTVEPMVAQAISLPRSVDAFVDMLKPSARRRIWHHRKRLVASDLRIIPAERVGDALDALNRYHTQRWGDVHYVGQRRAFHLQFAAGMAERGALRVSELQHQGETISVVYDVRLGDTEYNLQSGFHADTRGISPGYLHFGYCIERACHDGLRRFDFLAGTGLHRDYKRDFGTVNTRIGTAQVIRSRALSWLYRQYDRVFTPRAPRSAG